MNQIKFRAWDGKEMIVPTAVINGKAAILKRCNDDRVMEDSEGVHYYCNWDMDVVTDYPLMQFTGLQDKNGVDIYVGDVVSQKLNCLWDEGRHNLEVRFNHDQFQTGNVKSYSSLYSAVQSFDAEVIGNIHQNAELIKL
jgi:uncharacterized phage protein (TIGR01671 family)